MGNPGRDPRLMHDVGHLASDILHVSVASGSKRNPLLRGHTLAFCNRNRVSANAAVNPLFVEDEVGPPQFSYELLRNVSASIPAGIGAGVFNPAASRWPRPKARSAPSFRVSQPAE